MMTLLAAAALAAFASGFEGNDPPPPPPPAACISPYPNGVVDDWNTTFITWPNFNLKRRLMVPLNGYLSYRFVAIGSPTVFGSLTSSGFPGDGDGIGVMSISSSPGCFDADKLPQNCIGVPNHFVGVGWSNSASQYSCVLVAGRTYYLNYTYGGSLDTGGPNCPNSECGADVGNIQQ